ncbi:MAG: RecX family transcriptional regulator [Candidatus Sumerlaeia bacterium]|nr:RecX family transcriptional regulator [Candidatus Sumerlaeia bacterium]
MSERIVKLRVIRKRGRHRVCVELSSGESIEVAPEAAVGRHLKSGDELRAEEIETLRAEDETLRARQRLAQYLALRVKSVANARLYLEKAGFSERAINTALSDALANGLLDDHRFALRYVRTKRKVGGVGPLRLVHELIAHGVEPSLAEEIVRQELGSDQEQRAADVLARKLAQKFAHAGETADAVRRICDSLRRRGFNDDIAYAAAERAVKDLPNNPMRPPSTICDM